MSTILGKCPICENGQIVTNEANYQCNYFKDLENKCSFIIWKNQCGKSITEEIALQLIEKRKTDVFDDFFTKENKQFSACLIINDDNLVSLSFDSTVPDLKCPKCGDELISTKKSFTCKKNIISDCDFFISKIIAGLELDVSHLKQLIEDSETDFISGFQNNNGDSFDAKLVYNPNNEYSISFDSSICVCPKCKTGMIKEWSKNYSCSNYKADDICDFVIWKNQFGGEVNRNNAIAICMDGKSKVITFKNKKDNQPYKASILLKDDFTTEIVRE